MSSNLPCLAVGNMEVTWKESLPVTANNLERLLVPNRAMTSTAEPKAVLRVVLALFEPPQA